MKQGYSTQEIEWILGHGDPGAITCVLASITDATAADPERIVPHLARLAASPDPVLAMSAWDALSAYGSSAAVAAADIERIPRPVPPPVACMRLKALHRLRGLTGDEIQELAGFLVGAPRWAAGIVLTGGSWPPPFREELERLLGTPSRDAPILAMALRAVAPSSILARDTLTRIAIRGSMEDQLWLLQLIGRCVAPDDDLIAVVRAMAESVRGEVRDTARRLLEHRG